LPRPTAVEIERLRQNRYSFAKMASPEGGLPKRDAEAVPGLPGELHDLNLKCLELGQFNQAAGPVNLLRPDSPLLIRDERGSELPFGDSTLTSAPPLGPPHLQPLRFAYN
jgi:hypothetical protein